MTLPVVRALLDAAKRDNYPGGALGVRAAPRWDGPAEFEHAGQTVRVVPCVSALAVRRALRDRDPEHWLVVLTDRDDSDLGAGLLGHLAWYRTRTPDPWDAVRQRFAAAGLDPALVTGERARDLATGLLAAAPPGGWPPAPGGVLTRDHALAAVARARLALAPGGAEIGDAAVLTWTATPDAAARVADLRSDGGDAVADATLAWLAHRAGGAAPVLRALLTAGRISDVVPLGLVTGLLVAAAGDGAAVGRGGLVALQRDLGAYDGRVLRAWADEAAAAAETLLADAPHGVTDRVLARADRLLTEFQAQELSGRSALLPSGLDARLHALAVALRAAVSPARLVPDPDAPLVLDPGPVEAAWTRVAEHRLADGDPRLRAAEAAVRLTRWLALPAAAPDTGIRALTDRHTAVDAWADVAVDAVCGGSADEELARALGDVAAVARRRRTAHDRVFAKALAAHTADDPTPEDAGVRHVEDLLRQTVLPLARETGVLLLVGDGMSVAAAAQVVADVTGRAGDGWQEALLTGQPGRAGALAVMPSLTDPSRTSLLSGELRSGSRSVEAKAFPELCRAAGLPGVAPLFHKGPLDSSRPGFAVADDVSTAVDDVARRPLVACVLNAVDDSLDRSDPGGTVWGLDTVKHLRPLLDRARHAGRVVVLTADHGHVIERRQGEQRRHAGASSGRSRAAEPGPAGEEEVLVVGRRVLTTDGRAVLAVDEGLRYGPLKAGYHGGASPAEVVVPVVVLVPGAVPEPLEGHLVLAPPQEPDWWTGPATAVPGPSDATVEPVAAVRPVAGRAVPSAAPTLFDDVEDVAPATGPDTRGLVAAVLASPTYAEQKQVSGRLAVGNEQVERLLAALLTAPDHRLVPARAASALAVPVPQLKGALLHAQRLLNVESYGVLRFDADGLTVTLDEPLLREQFGLPG